MSNDHIKAEIPSYLAGGLTESRNRQIEAHASTCEKCRYAITKARTKQARVKREALKKASHDPLPNLFLARQGKDSGADGPVSKIPWLVVGVVILAGIGYKVIRHSSLFSSSSSSLASTLESPTVQISSVPAPSPHPATPPTVSVSPVVNPPLPKPPVTLTIQQEWNGPDSGIKEVRLVVVRTPEAWEKLWTDMQEIQALPTVNFSQHVVLGIFGGERPQGSAISFGKIKEMDEEVYAPYRITAGDVQTSTTTVPAPAPAVSHPYLLSLIPRVEKKIRLTQKEASQ